MLLIDSMLPKSSAVMGRGRPLRCQLKKREHDCYQASTTKDCSKGKQNTKNTIKLSMRDHEPTGGSLECTRSLHSPRTIQVKLVLWDILSHLVIQGNMHGHVGHGCGAHPVRVVLVPVTQ